MKIAKKTLFKAIGLLLFVVACFVIIRMTGLYQFLSKDYLQGFVKRFGLFGPVVYVLIFAAGVALLAPATPFTIAGAIIFGPWLGTLLNIIAVALGSVGAFYIARKLGREFARKAEGSTLAKYDEKLEQNGFATIFYLRMILLPLAPVNYAAGLTRINVKDFLLGTILGALPATIIIMFFVSKLTDIHSWTDLLTWDCILALLLFIASFFIPTIIKHHFKKKILDKKK